MQAAIPDILRLVAVPVLGWAAVRDVRTRRVPNGVWWPLAVLGLLLVGWEAAQLWNGQFGLRLYLLRLGLSVGIVVPLAYAFWYLGGFGGADAKAFMVLALLFPTFPTYEILGRTLPLVVTDLGVFSLSVLTNTVLVGLVFPLALGVRNLLHGEISWVMLLGHRVPVAELPRRHGTLLETPTGLTSSGLDLDALRMYLRWRGLDLEAIRSEPGLADPATLPAEPNDPTDGAVSADGGILASEDAGLVPDGGTGDPSDGEQDSDSSEGKPAPDPDSTDDQGQWEWIDVEDRDLARAERTVAADDRDREGRDVDHEDRDTGERDVDHAVRHIDDRPVGRDERVVVHAGRKDAGEERGTDPADREEDLEDSDGDRWGAATFLEDIDSSAYGTTPESLRDGLDVVVESETVWVSPGVPFIVPTFVGLVVALTAGDVLFFGLRALGLVGP